MRRSPSRCCAGMRQWSRCEALKYLLEQSKCSFSGSDEYCFCRSRCWCACCCWCCWRRDPVLQCFGARYCKEPGRCARRAGAAATAASALQQGLRGGSPSCGTRSHEEGESQRKGNADVAPWPLRQALLLLLPSLVHQVYAHDLCCALYRACCVGNFSSGEAPSAAAPVAGSGIQPHQRAAAAGQRPAAAGTFWAAGEQPRQLTAMPQHLAATKGQHHNNRTPMDDSSRATNGLQLPCSSRTITGLLRKGSSQSAHQRGASDAIAASGKTSCASSSRCCRVRLFSFSPSHPAPLYPLQLLPPLSAVDDRAAAGCSSRTRASSSTRAAAEYPGGHEAAASRVATELRQQTGSCKTTATEASNRTRRSHSSPQGSHSATERLRSSNGAAAYALQRQRELPGSNSPTSAWSHTGSPSVMGVAIEIVAIKRLYPTSSDSTAVYAHPKQQAAATPTAAGNSGQPQNCTNRFQQQQQRLSCTGSRNSAELQPSRGVAGGRPATPGQRAA